MKGLIRFIVLCCAFQSMDGKAETSKFTTYSLLGRALTSNAGGQEAYSLRRAKDDTEMSVFANLYLYAGNYPLVGATYAWRYDICGDRCFWQFYIQAGGGLSTAGPLVEFTWSSILLWTMRIDITSHLMVIPYRVVTWSYPLWVGVSLPL